MAREEKLEDEQAEVRLSNGLKMPYGQKVGAGGECNFSLN